MIKSTVTNNTTINNIMWEIYHAIMHYYNGKDYSSLRLRLAIFLLTVTYLKISELLPLKVRSLQILEQKFFLTIGNRTLFIDSNNAKLHKIIRDRQEDILSLSRMKNENDFIFTSHLNLHSNKPLRRESLTRLVNTALKVVVKNSKFFQNKQLTSNSFQKWEVVDLEE